MRIIVWALVSLFALHASFSCIAQETSDKVGSIKDLLVQGYGFVGGSGLGPEETQLHVIAGSRPDLRGEAISRSASLYLVKDRDLLVCSYSIVTRNPIVEGYDAAGPRSACYRIK
jgi:hypothetical protein